MVAIVLTNGLVVAAAVLVHYEFLRQMTRAIARMRVRHGLRILFGLAGALVAHTVEVWLFAAAYYFKHWSAGWGRLTGNFDGSLLDCAYFSFTVFSTLGFGDIVPRGELRHLTGIESLTGLVLITWTASFLFVEMQKYWDSR